MNIHMIQFIMQTWQFYCIRQCEYIGLWLYFTLNVLNDFKTKYVECYLIS